MSFKPKQTNLNNLKHVELLDVLMGSGKTYASLRHIESMALANKQVKWVFCTEFLSEIATRTVENEEAKHLWRTPEKVGEESKMDDFINLLEEPNVQLIAIRTYIIDVGVHKKLARAELKSKIIKLQEELAKL
jgi:hypothetical protein